VDRRTASSIALHVGVEDVLDALQSTRKHRSFGHYRCGSG
jgi:hypothetical protein